jgi:hypothetical protein
MSLVVVYTLATAFCNYESGLLRCDHDLVCLSTTVNRLTFSQTLEKIHYAIATTHGTDESIPAESGRLRRWQFASGNHGVEFEMAPHR